jgi:hypothetical protein
VVTALGAQIDLRGSTNNLAQVSNKQSRVEALRQVIGKVFRVDNPMLKMAAEWTGRVQRT